jgi:Tfp pilus assembly protein PilN
MEVIDINLLPGRKRKKHLRKEDKQIIFIGVSIFFLLIAMYGGVWYVKKQKTDKLSQLNNQVNALKSVQELLNTRSTLNDQLLYYQNTIKNYTLKQSDWNDLINQIALSLPKETKLSSIEADKKSMTVTITGETKNVQTLAWTVYGLSNNKNFSNIVVSSYNVPYQKALNTKGPQNTTFTITFKWKGMKK